MSDFIIGLTGGVASGKSEVARRFEALGVHVADADVIARAVVEPGQPALAGIVERFGTQMLRADGSLDRRRLRELVFADPQARRDLEAITHPAIRRALQAECTAAAGPYAIAAIPLLAEAGARAVCPGGGGIDGPDAAGQIQTGACVVYPDGRDAAQQAGIEAGVPAVCPERPDAAKQAKIEAGVRTVYPWLDRILVVDAPVELQHARLMRRDGVDEALATRMIAAQVARETRLAIADDVLVNDGHPDHLDAPVAELDARYRALAAAPPL